MTDLVRDLGTPGPLVLACLGLLAASALAAAAGWRWPRSRVLALLQLAPLGCAGLLAALAEPPVAPERLDQVLVVATTGALALIGGGPLTTAVFGLVDGRHPERPGSMRRAGEVLRGGAWIGALERGAVFVAVAAGWPEGIAISLAVKGLGRYPELRHEERAGIAERFLIGTFVSVLWAAACAGVGRLLLG